jgi:hypothetical protein
MNPSPILAREIAKHEKYREKFYHGTVKENEPYYLWLGMEYGRVEFDILHPVTGALCREIAEDVFEVDVCQFRDDDEWEACGLPSEEWQYGCICAMDKDRTTAIIQCLTKIAEGLE